MPTFRTSPDLVAADVTSPHLILVGLPGAGKTTVGKAAAAALGRRFLDFDAEIERREGMRVGEIFESSGEESFRVAEKRLTEELRQVAGFVLAPGGGWMTNLGCLELLRPPGIVVYLQVEPARALERMGLQAVARPLLNHPDPLGQLIKLFAARESTYLLANHTVRVDFRSEKEITAAIVALAQAASRD